MPPSVLIDNYSEIPSEEQVQTPSTPSLLPPAPIMTGHDEGPYFMDFLGTVRTQNEMQRQFDSLHYNERDPEHSFRDWFKAGTESRPCPICHRLSARITIPECFISPSGCWAACMHSFDRRGEAMGSADDFDGHSYTHLIFEMNARIAWRLDDRRALLQKHLDELHASGLRDETVRALGIYSIANRDQIGLYLNWESNTMLLGPSIVYPYHQLEGTTPSYWRLKPDFARPNGNGKPIKYEAPKGQPSQLYFAAVDRLEEYRSGESPLFFTEGEKKSIKLCQEGYLAAGLSGVWSWQQRRERNGNHRAEGPRELLADFEDVRLERRNVFLVFDSDIATNPNVLHAAVYFSRELEKRGASVRLVSLPLHIDNGHVIKEGIDDFLIRRGIESFEELLRIAGPVFNDLYPINDEEKFTESHFGARLFLQKYGQTGGVKTLQYHQKKWYRYEKNTYKLATEEKLLGETQEVLKEAVDNTKEYRKKVEEKKQSIEAIQAILHKTIYQSEDNYEALTLPDYSSSEEKNKDYKPLDASPTWAERCLITARGLCKPDKYNSAPCWIGIPGPFPAAGTTAMNNGLFHVQSYLEGQPCFVPNTPRFFTTQSLDYDYDPTAPEPQAWLDFLHSVWPDDEESINTLQEFFGYLLIDSNKYQKMFMLKGPTRSGKGVISKTIEMLVGKDSYIGPTFSYMKKNERFALESFVNKRIAIFNDARHNPSPADTEALLEPLLNISGGGTLTFDQKGVKSSTLELTTRILICTNVLPALRDPAGVVANRFVFLNMKNSFLGNEDPSLFNHIQREASSIFNWALVGLRRLEGRRKFIQPASGRLLFDSFQALSNEAVAFFHDRMEFCDASNWISTGELFKAYMDWCIEQDISVRKHNQSSSLIKELKAALPHFPESIQKTIKGQKPRGYPGIRKKQPKQ